MVSEWRPGCLAEPPRLRALRGGSDHRPLKASRMKVSSASMIPLKLRGLSAAGAPRKRCRQRNAVVGCTPQSSAVLARLLPSIIARAWSNQRSLLCRCAIAVKVERIEAAPTALAAKPRKPMRASPTRRSFVLRNGDSLGSPRAHGRSSPKRPDEDPASRLCPSPRGRRGLGLPLAPKFAIRFAKAAATSRRCSTLSRPTPENQTENSSAFIESNSSSPPKPNPYQQVSL